MTVKELIDVLNEYGSHVEVKAVAGNGEPCDLDEGDVVWSERENAVVIEIA